MLVAAQSHVAVDNLVDGFHKAGLRAVRVADAARVRPELQVRCGVAAGCWMVPSGEGLQRTTPFSLVVYVVSCRP